MITFEEAVKIAKKVKPGVDTCYEYENGYVFSRTDEADCDGGVAPCVVLKEDGKTMSMPGFVLSGTGKDVGERKF